MATVAWAVAMAVVTVATVTAAPALYAVEDTGPTASTEKFLSIRYIFPFCWHYLSFLHMRNF